MLSLDHMIIIQTSGACAHGSLKHFISASLYTNTCSPVPKEIESWIFSQTDLNITNHVYTLVTCGLPSQRASNRALMLSLAAA